MKTDDKAIADGIIAAIGGMDNIRAVGHCSTRLRLTLHDKAKVDEKAIEDIEASLKGMLKPEYEEVVTSHSEIREIFRSSKFGNIAGVMVQDGEVKRGTKCRILRNGVATVNDLEISSLRRFKDDVTSVKEGYEAGINLGSFNDIEIGDIIETFEMQEVERK